MTDVNADTSEFTLAPDLQERVIARLGLTHRPEPTLAGLRALYSAWSRHVPFDNVRKLIHMRSGNTGPLPGYTPEDFLNGWLAYGTGGTCWSGAGALHAVLQSLGFDAQRVVATMLVVPDLPPNHGSVQVTLDEQRYLVDSAMLCVEPLLLDPNAETGVKHRAWGLKCRPKAGRWHIAWRPLHKVEGFECRLERFGATAAEYQTFYDATRSWSPFNYQVTARANRNDAVVGMAFGNTISLLNDGTVSVHPSTHEERIRVLIEQIDMSEEIVRQLPQDIATPPPPWSKTANVTS